MRGGGVAKPQQQSVLQGEGVSTPELKADTVEISAKDKIEEPQKKGMSTGAKWALGILGGAATIYGCVVGHRALTKPSLEKVAQNFSEIFRRDVSKDEAQKLVSEYKDLLKIEDTEEFCKKAFEKVKKDYGYENLNIPLIIEPMSSAHGAAASWSTNRGKLAIFNNLNCNIGEYGRKRILRSLIHEFQHAKQTEISYRTSPEKLLDAIRDSSFRHRIEFVLNLPKEKQEALAKEADMSLDDFVKYLKEIGRDKNGGFDLTSAEGKKLGQFNRSEVSNCLDSLFGEMPKFAKGSKEYELGMKYIEAERNYVPHNLNEVLYRKNLLEVDAYATESKWSTIYNYFANPWRL